MDCETCEFYSVDDETGDPVCYMLYKAAKNNRPKQETDKGETPRVSD